MLILVILIILAGTILAVLQEMITFDDCDMNIILYHFFYWSFTCLDLYVDSCHLIFFSWYVICCLRRSGDFLWLRNDFFIWYLLTNWFFTWLDLYVIPFFFNYCRKYVIGFFTRNDYFWWLWHEYHFILSLFIDFLLA